MAQIFHRSTNFISRFSVFFGALLAALALGGVMGLARAPYLTNQNVTREQPIQFSHKHHVGDDGIDCRYCHTSVGIHINKGVGCSSCHGQVNQMPLVFQASPLLMKWCLDCHRNPEAALRPHDQVFNMDWKAPADQAEVGKQLAAEYKIQSVAQLQSCSTCHR